MHEKKKLDHLYQGYIGSTTSLGVKFWQDSLASGLIIKKRKMLL